MLLTSSPSSFPRRRESITSEPQESRPVENMDPRLRGDDGEGRNTDEWGFTLIELMVVILILGLLATVVVINVMPAQDKAGA